MVGKRREIIEPVPGVDAGDQRPAGALLRGLQVLRAFRPGHGSLGNAEIAIASRLPKATVSRLTRALVEAGYLDYDPASAKYQLRPRVLTMGFAMLSNLPILPAAREQMRRLANLSGGAVSLAAADQTEMIYLDRCSGEAMPYFMGIGSAVDMVSSSIGRAYLAGLDEPGRRTLIERLARLHADVWPAVSSGIEDARAQVAQRGFCLVDGEWRRNVRAVAAPIVSRDGRNLLVVNCAVPIHAMAAAVLVEKWGPPLFHMAQLLSEQF
jgi:DNA-binding IclR family transcriptional regulator